MTTQYWCFRIDTWRSPDFYADQLEKHGRLRQGWGWSDDQDLRKIVEPVPKDQKPNLKMFNEVKKGDIILVPRTPQWPFVTIARATEDWNVGYHFEIDAELKDFGHCFPAEYDTHFDRHDDDVRGDLRTTLRCRSRFWNANHCKDSIEQLVGRDPDELTSPQSKKVRFNDAVRSVLGNKRKEIEDDLLKALSGQFESAEWEEALKTGLEALFPTYQVEVTGGRGEEKHGTDILLTMPGLLEDYYGIALQVKDWQGEAWNIRSAIAQIENAEEDWREIRADLRIVDKIIILTEVNELSPDAQDEANKKNITILHSEGLKRLLRKMAFATVIKEGDDK